MNGSPLRYPGGKSLMTHFLIELFNENGLQNVTYVEPYAGGAGAAINLLLGNHVNNIIINDANIGIYSFWHYLLTESDKFINTVQRMPVTLAEWFQQKQIAQNSNEPSFELGIATFFLSRTNRSGVIKGGPIGGNSIEKQQQAKYKLDCRFNKTNLIERLNSIVHRKESISVCNMDALDFLRTLQQDNTFVYLDPPYYIKGKSLYMNHYREENHQQLANYLLTEAPFLWLLSYDDTPQIREKYKDLDLYNFPLNYTVSQKRIGYELLTHSPNLHFPNIPNIKRNTRGKNIPIERIFQ